MLTISDNTIRQDQLRDRRLQWLDALESEDYAQAQGALFAPLWEDLDPADPDYDDEENSPYVCGRGFCCLGVARVVPDPGWSELELADLDQDYNEDIDYKWVQEYYGISEELKDYLISMNDGSTRGNSTRLVPSRQFPFIASFLRKVWGLTNV